MKEKDINFLQSVINELIRYVTRAEIENENAKKQFKVIYVNANEDKD